MCLIIKEDCEIETAKKDITTYKKVRVVNDSFWSGIFFGGRFRFNKLEKAVTKLSINIFGTEIDEGFHSFKRLHNNYITHGKSVICIIPKGSEYCLGTEDDIVSNQIIVFRTVFDYIKYKLWKLFH